MTGEDWDYISYEAKELVQSMLQYEPNNRISLLKAMKHPWIQRFDKSKQYQNAVVNCLLTL